jgi:hypothetical protein
MSTIEDCIKNVLEKNEAVHGLRVSGRIYSPLRRLDIFIERLCKKKGVEMDAEDRRHVRNSVIASVYHGRVRRSGRLVGRQCRDI